MTPSRERAPTPPRHLSAESRRWWKLVTTEWQGIEDHHLKLLELACQQWDRAIAAREVLNRDGIVFEDRFGSPRKHPLIAVERDAVATFGRLVRQLRLDETPPPSPESMSQWRRSMGRR